MICGYKYYILIILDNAIRPIVARQAKMRMDFLLYLNDRWMANEGNFWTDEKRVRQEIEDSVRKSEGKMEKMLKLIQRKPFYDLEVRF